MKGTLREDDGSPPVPPKDSLTPTPGAIAAARAANQRYVGPVVNQDSAYPFVGERQAVNAEAASSARRPGIQFKPAPPNGEPEPRRPAVRIRPEPQNREPREGVALRNFDARQQKERRADAPADEKIAQIFTGADGRIDPSTIKMREKTAIPGATPPASPSAPSTPRSGFGSRENLLTGRASGIVRLDPQAPDPPRRAAIRMGISKGLRRLSDAVGEARRKLSGDKQAREADLRSSMESARKSPGWPNIGLPQRKQSGGRASVASSNTQQGQKPLPQAPAMEKGEQTSGFPKFVNPFKRDRNNSAGSDMSFGMTDVAPSDAMSPCKQCGRQPETYLHSDGSCKDCHKLGKENARGK